MHEKQGDESAQKKRGLLRFFFGPLLPDMVQFLTIIDDDVVKQLKPTL